MFFVSNPNGIEGAQGGLPALSLARGNDILHRKRKMPMATAFHSLETLREEASGCRAARRW
jgi:hypothetical protein